MKAAAGGCLCGAVRYSINPPPRAAVYCHCSICRRAGGAPFVAWVETEAARFKLVRGALRWCQSSPQARRGFCESCGAQIVYDADWFGLRDFGVTAHTLDAPEIAPPSAHIWTQSAPVAAAIPNDGLPRYPQETPEFAALLAAARKRAKK